MKTVLQVLSDIEAKPGDIVTDGPHRWEITAYKNRRSRSPDTAKFYLSGVDGTAPLIAGGSLCVVVIPGLTKEQRKVTAYRYLYLAESKGKPSLTSKFYRTLEEASMDLKFKYGVLTWVKCIDETAKTIDASA